MKLEERTFGTPCSVLYVLGGILKERLYKKYIER